MHFADFFDCSGKIAKSRDLSLSTGICVPKSCSTRDVREITAYIYSLASLNVTSVHCETKHPITFRVRIIAIVIFSTLLLAVILSTIYELHMIHNEGERSES